MTRFDRIRWLVFAVVIAGMAASVVALVGMRDGMREIGLENPNGPIWFTTGVEYDVARVEGTLTDFARGSADQDEVALRFDILWSRLSQIGKGAAAQKLDGYDIDVTAYDDLRALLTRVEGQVATLDDVARREAFALADEFRAFLPGLRQISLATLDASAAAATGWRDRLLSVSDNSLILSGALGVGVLLLAFGFALESQHTRRELRLKKALLEEAQVADLAKTQFIAVVNHELRGPLSTLNSAIYALDISVGKDMPPKFVKLVRTARTGSAQLTSLVNDLLEADTYATGQSDYAFETAGLAELLKAQISVNQPYARAFGVEIVAEELDRDLRVDGDLRRLGQVVSNLLTNAAKFSNPGDKVSVSLKRVGGKVVLAVKDTGRGIPEALRERIFERFFQADDAPGRERSGIGLGIGLSIVRSVVEAHRGEVTFESTPGRGTTFFVRLPEAA